MKKNVFPSVFLTASILCFFCFPLQAQQEVENQRIQIKIEVKGLSCPFCAYGLEKRLRELPAVQSVDIQLKEGVAVLKFLKEKAPSEQELREAIEKAGFESGRLIACQVGENCDF